MTPEERHAIRKAIGNLTKFEGQDIRLKPILDQLDKMYYEATGQIGI